MGGTRGNTAKGFSLGDSAQDTASEAADDNSGGREHDILDLDVSTIGRAIVAASRTETCESSTEYLQPISDGRTILYGNCDSETVLKCPSAGTVPDIHGR